MCVYAIPIIPASHASFIASTRALTVSRLASARNARIAAKTFDNGGFGKVRE